ncbi:MAG: hypothetical protein P8J89_01115 [Phycisphaerales bacterium]|nr:hypothetical protein [Phycisphaerales bacterium]
MRITSLFIVSCSLLVSCGYKPAPKPPGYDSVTTTQADGIPPILSSEQLDKLDEGQLSQRIGQLETTLKNTHGNAGVSDILTSQLQDARNRMNTIQNR